MRHRKKLKKLGLKKSHRDSLLKNLIADLVLHERIRTTESRAKALAARLGKLMTLVRKKEPREAIRVLPKYCADTAHGTARRKIIAELKPRYEQRASGFTRITRVGMRRGDNARLVQIQLV